MRACGVKTGRVRLTSALCTRRWFEVPEDELQGAKEALLGCWGLGAANRVRHGPLPAKLLAMLRVSLLDAAELARGSTHLDPFQPVSARNEREALMALRITLQSLLDEVLEANPTADHVQQQTAEAAQADEPDDDLRMVLTYRRAHVALLRENLTQVHALLERLE